MANYRVLVSDSLDSDGLDILHAADELDVVVDTGLSPEDLKIKLKDFDAIVIRSGTKITADSIEGNTRLKVIGRAGIGVDNVDVEAATAAGMLVMNTPGGNAITTAEHALSLLMSAARMIPQAYSKLKAGTWDRKTFVGTELTGKTMGIIGLGNIGALVAERAQGLKMRVIGFDPMITKERAAQMGIEVKSFDEVIAEADVISLHVPLNDKTRNLISTKQFEQMKSGAILVNCARGGIVDEAALDIALNSNQITAAALDVFAEEPPAQDNPLLNNPKVVYTPHLGASTVEAQVKVAVAVAEQIRDFLVNGEIRNAVNAPSISGDSLKQLAPYITLGEKLGKLVSQVHEGRIEKISIRFDGEIAGYDTSAVVSRVVKGILEFGIEEPVNVVNAVKVASNRGIDVEITTSETAEDFASSIVVAVHDNAENSSQATGAVFGKHEPRIVRINQFLLESLSTEGPFVLVTNKDVPGVIGKIGALFGSNGLNIAQMYVGRRGTAKDVALTIVSLDEPAADEILAQLDGVDEILTVQQVIL